MPMKKQVLRCTLYAVIVYLASFTLNLAIAASQPAVGDAPHFCGVVDCQPGKRYVDQFANRRYARSSTTNLNVGEPRTVRLIYFLPNDRPYREDVVQRMKEMIRGVQTFYAEQMAAHGYGSKTFRVETDPQGDPIVHRVDGGHPDIHYLDDTVSTALDEIEGKFDVMENIYLIVIDSSSDLISNCVLGLAIRQGKKGGVALVTEQFQWYVAAHELGHTFGLYHDFRDSAYMMSYGPGNNQLSACSAHFLSVHSYFNPNIPIIEEGSPPTIKLISSRVYPAGSGSIPVQLKVSDLKGLHQVWVSGSNGLKVWRGLVGKRDAIVEFDYDGFIDFDGFRNLSSDVIHPISVAAVDATGNVSESIFWLGEKSPYHITTLEGHTGAVNSVSFSPDGITLASTGKWDDTVRLWDVKTGHHIGTLEGRSVAFSPDGITLASGRGNGPGRVKLWDVATRRNIATLEGHTDGVLSVAFSPNGKTIASGSYDGTAKLWDVATRRNIATLEGHTGGVLSVAFSPDGKTIASGSYDGTAKLWDVATRTNIATLEDEELEVWIHSVVFSPDGATLASGRGNGPGRVKLWDVATSKNVISLEHGHNLTSVAFSPDGTILASGARVGRVKLWDVATGTNIATLLHPSAEVWSVLFSPDGMTFAYGTADGTVELWDTSQWTEFRSQAMATIDIPDPNLRAAIATALGKSPSSPMVRGHLASLDLLFGYDAAISDLTGLDAAINLIQLVLEDNRISDISPLADLTPLLGLFLPGNNISDISPVANLTNLRKLDFKFNNISDISMVAGLTNLTELNFQFNSISDIFPVSGLTNLRSLALTDNNISDISAVAELTNLRTLWLDDNPISDISAVAGLTNLTTLVLSGKNISDISPVAGLTNLQHLYLRNIGLTESALVPVLPNLTQLIHLALFHNNISDVSVFSGLTNLPGLDLSFNNISDLLPLAGLTNLKYLGLYSNKISDISPLADLTNLTSLTLGLNSVSDISALVGLAYLTKLELSTNNISDISPVAGLAYLTELHLHYNRISDISALSGLTNLKSLSLQFNSISDLSPLVANTGLGSGDRVIVSGNPLSYQSIHMHIPALQSRGVTVEFDNQAHPALLKISGDNQKGTSLASLPNPLVIEAQDANGSPLVGISVTFAVAGGGTLSTTITRTDTNGRAQSTLTLGPNLGTNTVQVSAAGIEVLATFHAVSDTESPLITADVNGDGSVNILDLVVIAASFGQSGQHDADVNRDGVVSIVDLVLVAGMFDAAAAAPSALRQAPATLTAVEVQDWLTDARTLEVRDPIMKRGIIVLEQLLVSLTPKETMLLVNYPNPFNPETWIPYRLAEDAFVTLTIYDQTGRVVRTLDVGHRIAAVYENRAKAIYWDGRNELGEQVASGIYFYQLSAGDYSATRRMVILK